MNGKRYVGVEFVSDSELQPPPNSKIVYEHTHLNLLDDKPRQRWCVLRFDNCVDAKNHARQYDCPRFNSLYEATDWADCGAQDVLLNSIGVKICRNVYPRKN